MTQAAKNSPVKQKRAVFAQKSTYKRTEIMARTNDKLVQGRNRAKMRHSKSAGAVPALDDFDKQKLGLIGPILVSRAGYKLLYAMRVFQYDFREKFVLDIGSSTGGFTEVALRNGAKTVLAVEIGTNQMHPTLAHHPAVILREKTDFCVLKNTENYQVDTILADISFMSLTKIIKCAIINGWVGANTDFLVMFKPQFEVSPSFLINGVLKNSAMRRQAIKKFETWLKTNHILIKAKQDNVLAGKNGNVERFYWLKYIKII